MQQRQTRAIWLIVIVVGFFFIIDPFGFFSGNPMPEYRTSNEKRAEILTFLTDSARPDDFVAGLVANHDVVMIGTSGYRSPQYVRQQVEFLVESIPTLYDSGVRILGLEYAAKRDQQRIDTLVTSSGFDEQVVSDILFDYQVTAGYEEYVDIYRAVWSQNQRLTGDEDPLRILALTDPPDYSLISGTDDVGNPDIMSQVFAGGTPDEQIAQTIMEEVIASGAKAVTFTAAQHAFTGFEQVTYTRGMAELGFDNARTAGNILRSELGDRVVTVIMHGPIEDSRPRTRYGYPLGGLIENAVRELDAHDNERGFLTADFPLAEAPIVSDVVQQSEDDEVLFSEYTDGYIVLGPIAEYETLTPIPGFIDEARLASAIRNFPGPDPGDVSVADLNDFIAGNAQTMVRVFETFK